VVGDGKNLINLSLLYEKTMDDREAAKELITFFLQNVHIFLNNSEDAIKLGESNKLFEIAKKIENGAKHIYSDKIVDIANDIESCSTKHDFEKATTDLAILYKVIHDLEAFQKAI